ncbi:MFS transporter [Pigmentibacter ruber]|uniref:hypothetical protein n=1 Tax=Pigmentibacter ruber TaxID=2683196 RepID=UPI00131B48B2|nr:hypothetical protein [Pigmentibacter ruber]
MDIKNIINLIIGRFISNIGSTICTYSILLYLVSSKRESEIPFVILASVTGSFLGNWVILPRLLIFSSKEILIFANFCAGIFTFLICIFEINTDGNYILSKYSLALFSLIFTLFSILITASAQQFLTSENTTRYLHLDSTFLTATKILAPSISIILLFTLKIPIIYIILINGLSYLISALFIFLFLKNNKINYLNINSYNQKGLFSFYINNYFFWIIVIIINLMASTYNGGILVYLNKINLNPKMIAVFMTIQNISMLVSGFITTKWPLLTRHRKFAGIMSGGGLAIIGSSNNLLVLSLGNIIMAIGMTLLLNGFRSFIAEIPNSDSSLKRIYFGQLAFISSVTNLFGILLFSFLTINISSWGAIFIISGFCVLIISIMGTLYSIKRLVY